jgi:dephospho-CoA kinase
MLSLRKIAVTGGIASGKTTVCRLLKKHGAYQVSADDIIHQLLEKNAECKRHVIDLLGPDILTDDMIDRTKVASLVFSDHDKLQQLENLLHPLLFTKIEEEYKKVEHDNRYCCFVAEVPLIQEIGKEKEFDLILAVIGDEKTAKERFIAAGFSKQEYDRRMKRQWDPEKKAELADFTITNDGDIAHLENQVKEFIHTLI